MAVAKGPEYTLWLQLPAFTMQCKTTGLYITFVHRGLTLKVVSSSFFRQISTNLQELSSFKFCSLACHGRMAIVRSFSNLCLIIRLINSIDFIQYLFFIICVMIGFLSVCWSQIRGPFLPSQAWHNETRFELNP